MKRYRDENGKLTISTRELAKLTYDEANTYYKHGAKYTHDGKIYVCHRFKDENANEKLQEVQFTSEDGHNLVCDPEKLGTFLPDVASDGMEIVKIFDVGSGYMGNGISYWNRAEEIHGDYKTIAHIEPDRYVTFYEPLPKEVKQEIINYAASRTPQNSGNPIFYDSPPILPSKVQYTEYQYTLKRADM